MTSRSRFLRLSGALGIVVLGSIRCNVAMDPQPLQRFETCDALQLYLEDQILNPGVETSFSTSGPVVGCAPADALAGLDNEDRGGGEGEGERQFTKTNTQEVEVDEPDFVKNDGDKIFVLRRGEMIILRAWPATEMNILSRTRIAGTPFTMLFEDVASGESRPEHALVLSSLFSTTAQLLVKLYDVSDPTSPVELRSVLIDGEFVDARRVGDEVMLVTRSFLNVDTTTFNSAPFSDDENREKLRQQGLDRLLPRVEDFIVGQDTSPRVERAVACENTYAPSRSDGRNILLIHGLSISDARQTMKSTGVVAGFSHVYGSIGSLYLASTEFADGGYFTPSFATTRIHKLNAFVGAGAAEYRATGVFLGQIKDELSLDEGPDGTLRMVITDNSESQDFQAQTTSLLVIEENGTNLLEVARVENIGQGEQVESVRFIGDKAYIVTYPVDAGLFFDTTGLPRIPFTDPLFVVDLGDPRAPKLRGELIVDGYSAYIHPLDENHLLTVGVNTDPDDNAYLGMKLTVFDVSDPDAPAVAHTIDIAGPDGSSEALVERHAFTYFGAQKTLALPIQNFNTSGFMESTRLVVYRVDAEAGFEFVGNVEQNPLFTQTFGEVTSATAGPCAGVRRSVMIADDDEAYVYAISTAGVTAADLLSNDLATVATVSIANDEDFPCDPAGGAL